MKLVIQRVKSASVRVEGKSVASINTGILVLLGVSQNDDGSQIPYLAKNLLKCVFFLMK